MSKKDRPPQTTLSLEEQVDQLSQALLREYMHKKQFKETLKVFDEENPRNDKTISSRALMAELMNLTPSAMAQMKGLGIDTIMDMLCHIRLEKAEKALVHKTTSKVPSTTAAAVDTPLPDLPPDPELVELIDSLTGELKKMKKQRKKEKALLTEAKSKEKAEKKDAKKKKAKGLLSIDELLAQDDSEKLRKLAEAKSATEAAPPVRREGDKAQPQKKAEKVVEPSSSSDDSGGSDSDDDDEDDYAAAMRKIKEEDAQALRKRQAGWDAVDQEPPTTADAAPKESPARQDPSSDRESVPSGADHLGMEMAMSLKECLVNDRKIPSSFTEQGFYFSNAVEYGLEQRAGGPCGVLAVVQALIVGDLFMNRRMLTDDVKRNALVTSLAAILTKIGPLSRVAVVTDSAKEHRFGTNKEQLEAISRCHLRRGFGSRQELEFFLAEHLRLWMKPNGTGLLCFVLSCVLTRTIEKTKSDMDVELPLIVDHGYCSQELVNLLLCGIAVSNVHDGIIRQGDIAIKGFESKLEVGFLSYMEHRKLLRVGTFGKGPKLPVWVVNHESHYTTLFMKGDKRSEIRQAFAQAHQSVFDLFFWDQLGGQDEEIRLTVTLEESEVPPPSKGVIVPYLNDIIRTMEDWSTARVSWNGTDPLL